MDQNLFVSLFIKGTIDTFTIQCSVDTTALDPIKKTTKTKLSNFDLAAIITIASESLSGTASLCFPSQTFINIMSAMLDEEYTEITSGIEDGAGELLNIIFGYVKKELNDSGHKLEKAIPTIVSGEKLKVNTFSKNQSAYVIKFNSTAGDFFADITFEN